MRSQEAVNKGEAADSIREVGTPGIGLFQEPSRSGSRSRSKVQVFEPGIYEFTGGKLISTTVNPVPEPPFNGAELGLLAHLYRGEMYRSKVWRTRLDATTNWAVATTGIALSVAFSNAGNSPLPLVLVALMALMFLAIEARRYRLFQEGKSQGRVKVISTT